MLDERPFIDDFDTFTYNFVEYLGEYVGTKILLNGDEIDHVPELIRN